MFEESSHDPYKYDKFTGKEPDEEDLEEEATDSEEITADLKQAHEDIERKLPNDFNETISDVLETIGIHYNPKDGEWGELIDRLGKMLEKLEMTDEVEIEDKIDEEFAHELSEIQKNTRELAKKKIH